MCGINGFNFTAPEHLRAMNQKTKHRGPDDGGDFFSRQWSLGHNRLSIIDLSPLGHQPMVSADGRYVIVFNGEIYNYLELRTELEQCGYTFKSQSDTEVLLYAFIAWREKVLARLNGIFAFAILNTVTEELFLARDRFGVKPLYYYYQDKKFIFSSEVKAIATHPITLALNNNALNFYFRLLYVPSPLTMWENIFKLPPAHYAVVKDGVLRLERYWSFAEPSLLTDKVYIEQELRNLLKDSVRRQLVADRPVGVFLSGGVDSTIITGIAAEISPHINTFSVGFEATEESEKYNRDCILARQTANYFGTTHHEYRLSAQDIQKNLERTIYHMDEPISNHVQTVNLLLAEHTAKVATVVLGGDGGDELFGGYERYYYNLLIDRFQKIPRFLRKNALVSSLFALVRRGELYKKINTPPGVERYFSFFAQKERLISSFLAPSYNRPEAASAWFQAHYFQSVLKNDFTRQFMRTDIQTWLPDESLARSDKMTMAAALEERVPFLDYRLVELADRIPVQYKIGSKGLHIGRIGTTYEGKTILRSALKDYLPPHVLNQPKWGWFSPASKWIRGPLNQLMKEALSAYYCAGTKDLFDFNFLQTLLADHVSKRRYALNTLWSVMTFQLWYRQFFKK